MSDVEDVEIIELTVPTEQPAAIGASTVRTQTQESDDSRQEKGPPEASKRSESVKSPANQPDVSLCKYQRQSISPVSEGGLSIGRSSRPWNGPVTNAHSKNVSSSQHSKEIDSSQRSEEELPKSVSTLLATTSSASVGAGECDTSFSTAKQLPSEEQSSVLLWDSIVNRASKFNVEQYVRPLFRNSARQRNIPVSRDSGAEPIVAARLTKEPGVASSSNNMISSSFNYSSSSVSSSKSVPTKASFNNTGRAPKIDTSVLPGHICETLELTSDLNVLFGKPFDSELWISCRTDWTNAMTGIAFDLANILELADETARSTKIVDLYRYLLDISAQFDGVETFFLEQSYGETMRYFGENSAESQRAGILVKTGEDLLQKIPNLIDRLVARQLLAAVVNFWLGVTFAEIQKISSATKLVRLPYEEAVPKFVQSLEKAFQADSEVIEADFLEFHTNEVMSGPSGALQMLDLATLSEALRMAVEKLKKLESFSTQSTQLRKEIENSGKIGLPSDRISRKCRKLSDFSKILSKSTVAAPGRLFSAIKCIPPCFGPRLADFALKLELRITRISGYRPDASEMAAFFRTFLSKPNDDTILPSYVRHVCFNCCDKIAADGNLEQGIRFHATKDEFLMIFQTIDNIIWVLDKCFLPNELSVLVENHGAQPSHIFAMIVHLLIHLHLLSNAPVRRHVKTLVTRVTDVLRKDAALVMQHPRALPLFLRMEPLVLSKLLLVALRVADRTLYLRHLNAHQYAELPVIPSDICHVFQLTPQVASKALHDTARVYRLLKLKDPSIPLIFTKLCSLTKRAYAWTLLSFIYCSKLRSTDQVCVNALAHRLGSFMESLKDRVQDALKLLKLYGRDDDLSGFFNYYVRNLNTTLDRLSKLLSFIAARPKFNVMASFLRCSEARVFAGGHGLIDESAALLKKMQFKGFDQIFAAYFQHDEPIWRFFVEDYLGAIGDRASAETFLPFSQLASDFRRELDGSETRNSDYWCLTLYFLILAYTSAEACIDGLVATGELSAYSLYSTRKSLVKPDLPSLFKAFKSLCAGILPYALHCWAEALLASKLRGIDLRIANEWVERFQKVFSGLGQDDVMVNALRQLVGGWSLLSCDQMRNNEYFAHVYAEFSEFDAVAKDTELLRGKFARKTGKKGLVAKTKRGKSNECEKQSNKKFKIGALRNGKPRKNYTDQQTVTKASYGLNCLKFMITKCGLSPEMQDFVRRQVLTVVLKPGHTFDRKTRFEATAQYKYYRNAMCKIVAGARRGPHSMSMKFLLTKVSYFGCPHSFLKTGRIIKPSDDVETSDIITFSDELEANMSSEPSETESDTDLEPEGEIVQNPPAAHVQTSTGQIPTFASSNAVAAAVPQTLPYDPISAPTVPIRPSFLQPVATNLENRCALSIVPPAATVLTFNPHPATVLAFDPRVPPPVARPNTVTAVMPPMHSFFTGYGGLNACAENVVSTAQADLPIQADYYHRSPVLAPSLQTNNAVPVVVSSIRDSAPDQADLPTQADYYHRSPVVSPSQQVDKAVAFSSVPDSTPDQSGSVPDQPHSAPDRPDSAPDQPAITVPLGSRFGEFRKRRNLNCPSVPEPDIIGQKVEDSNQVQAEPNAFCVTDVCEEDILLAPLLKEKRFLEYTMSALKTRLFEEYGEPEFLPRALAGFTDSEQEICGKLNDFVCQEKQLQGLEKKFGNCILKAGRLNIQISELRRVPNDRKSELVRSLDSERRALTRKLSIFRDLVVTRCFTPADYAQKDVQKAFNDLSGLAMSLKVRAKPMDLSGSKVQIQSLWNMLARLLPNEDVVHHSASGALLGQLPWLRRLKSKAEHMTQELERSKRVLLQVDAIIEERDEKITHLEETLKTEVASGSSR